MLTYAPHMILFQGGDQTIKTIPLDLFFRPAIVTSPTYLIEDLRYDKDDTTNRVIASGNATQGSQSFTLTGACGPSQADATFIPFASPPSGWLNAWVMLLKADQTRELVFVRAVDTNGVYARHPVRRDYASGDTIRGIEVRATFPSSAAADEDRLDNKGGPMRVTWGWTDEDGNVDALGELIWLKRSKRGKVVFEQHLIKRWPAVARWAIQDDMIRNALDAAHEDYWSELAMNGLPIERFYTCDHGQLAITNRALYYLHMWRETEDSIDLAERFLDEWRRVVSGLTNGLPGAGVVTVSEDDAAPAGSNHGYQSIFIET